MFPRVFSFKFVFFTARNYLFQYTDFCTCGPILLEKINEYPLRWLFEFELLSEESYKEIRITRYWREYSSCRKHSVQGSQTSLHGLSRWEQGGTCQSSSNSQRNLTAIICLPLLMSFSTRYVTIKPSIGVLSDSIQGRQTTKSMHLILWMKKACNSRTYNASSTSTMLGSIWKNEWKIDRCCQPCSEWSLCTINANLCLRS